MADAYWDQGNVEVDESYDEESMDSRMSYILVNGATIEVQPGSSMKETVRTYARDAGLGKFRVFLNGSEVRPSEAPEVVEAGTKIELRPFDVAGI